MVIASIGAGCLGTVIGWYLYYINRYRKDEIKLEDLATVITALVGGTITKVFEDGSNHLFGAYGMGLFIGFFGYFSVLVFMVYRSNEFGIEWFLDGRRKKPEKGYICPSDTENRAMAD